MNVLKGNAKVLNVIENDLCQLKRMTDLINENIGTQEGSLGDFIFQIEADYQAYYELGEDDWGIAPQDAIGSNQTIISIPVLDFIQNVIQGENMQYGHSEERDECLELISKVLER